LDSHKVDKVSSTSEEETFEPAVGVNAAVALMRGVTQVWMDESALRAVRKDEHDAVMLDGMRVESDWKLV
jgi:hypothetical protein